MWPLTLIRTSSLIVLLAGYANLATSATLKVVTANAYLLRDTQWGNLKPFIPSRAKLIPSRMAATGADIINHQEVWSPDLRQQMITEMAALGYPYHAAQSSISIVNTGTVCGTMLAGAATYAGYRVARPGGEPETRRRWLRRLAWGTGATFASLGTYVGFGSYEHWVRMNNGLITFSRYPIRKLMHVNFSQVAAPEEIFVNKGAILMQIELPDGKLVWNLNTHLPATNDLSPREARARWGALQTMLRFLNEKTTAQENRIAAGDLNVHLFQRTGKMTYDTNRFSAEYAALRAIFGDDVFHRLHGIYAPDVTDTPKNPLRTGDEPEKFIDYIFASGPNLGRVIKAEVIQDGPPTEDERRKFGITDHPPTSMDHSYVVVEIEIL